MLNLLHTRDGSYAAACSLDFSKPPRYYDTFALRDSAGSKTLTQTFPYFASTASRQALIRGQPVPVQSCWNGMGEWLGESSDAALTGPVVFDAAPFYQQWSSTLDVAPLRFRAIPDSLATRHLEASECCLIHFDNPLTPAKGVWLNPEVRVGYNARAYELVTQRDRHGKLAWPSGPAQWSGIWWSRLTQLVGLCSFGIEHSTVQRRVAEWHKSLQPDVAEPGAACLINEMQILAKNGWAHV